MNDIGVLQIPENSFPSIFCKIKNKPPENNYPNNLVFQNFNPTNISYPTPLTSGQPGEYPETSAIKKAIEHCSKFKKDENNPFLLVSGDLSGIQDTVYTISSKGALKSLRARSFMLEFLCEHICFEIVTNSLGDYKDYRNHVIFNGGGSFCVLLPNIEKNINIVKTLKEKINNWVFKEFTGKLYTAIVYMKVNLNDITNEFKSTWDLLSDKLEIDKKQKFKNRLSEIFSDSYLSNCEPLQKNNKEECQICHRDDIDENEESFYDLNKLQQISNVHNYVSNNNEAIAVHSLCFQLFLLGKDLTTARFIYRVEKQPSNNGYIKFPSVENEAYYFVDEKAINHKCIWEINGNSPKYFPFYYANYSRKNGQLNRNIYEETERKFKGKYLDNNGVEFAKLDAKKRNDLIEGFKKDTADFESLAKSACGSNLIACLRMDVDNLGQIFSSYLEDFNLVTLSHLSKMLNLFFKVYVNDICKCSLGVDKAANKIEATNLTSKNYSNGRNVSIVYSGGDDLFIVGAWDEVAELSFDIQKCFKEYSGLSISAGVTLHKPNYPLYQISKISEKAIQTAKNEFKSKNRIALFYNSDFYNSDTEIQEKYDNYLKYTGRVRNASQTYLFSTGKKEDKKRLHLSSGWEETNLLVNDFVDLTWNLFKTNKLSQSTIYKFGEIIDEWYQHEGIYLPKLIWVLNDMKNIDAGKALYYFNQNNIRKMFIPITWLVYLIRS